MIVAPKPEDEERRLQALRDYDVLDTGAEAVFNDIVHMVSAICNVPIALVSLVDAERQWFKARVGLDAQEPSRDLAFCAHAILCKGPLVVENTLDDERFSDNPLVTGEPGIRFYAGVPLRTPEGYGMGTLCAIDTKPRSLEPSQLQLLQLLATHVINLMELRIRYRDSVLLANELSESRKQVLEMAQHNRRFLANLNHELRTPLNAIVGFSGRLSRRLEQEQVPDYVREGVHAIEKASGHLSHLIGDVLDLSKLDAGKMQRVDTLFNVRDLINEVVLLNDERAKKHDISLTLELSPSLPECLRGDAGKIGQVLMNIVSNAVKYTPSNKSIKVAAHYAEPMLTIKVEDEGVGIASDDLEKIFSEFEQISNPLSDRDGGTGLGLAIVSRIMELLDGKVNVESTLGQGSCFTLSFPLPASATP